MIEKAFSWRGRKTADLDRDFIDNKAILEPEFTKQESKPTKRKVNGKLHKPSKDRSRA